MKTSKLLLKLALRNRVRNGLSKGCREGDKTIQPKGIFFQYRRFELENVGTKKRGPLRRATLPLLNENK